MAVLRHPRLDGLAHAVHLMWSSPKWVGQAPGKPSGLIPGEDRCSNPVVMLRGCLGPIHAGSPFNDIQIDFQDPPL